MRDQRILVMESRLTAAAKKSGDPTRHRCFISYHLNDSDEVASFVDRFGAEIIGTCLGVTEDDDFVDSDDEDYIRRRIREEHLSTTTVTIVLLGRCTWARKFVDWEISSSLRNDPVNKRSGLLAIPLPSMSNSARLPSRFADNWSKDEASYALYRAYPQYAGQLGLMVEHAFQRRDSDLKVVNSRPLMTSNLVC